MLNLIIGFFQNWMNSLSEEYRIIANLLIYTIFILIYSFFIWKFYRFLSNRDILELNLRQYNYSKHPQLEKIFAIGLYIIEFVVILPFLVFFWFTIFSLFLLILVESKNAQTIFLISTALIASIRITAYLNKELSKELAKILPFSILIIFIINHKFFESGNLFEKISQIPAIWNNILIFVIFIFAVELILRLFYSFSMFFVSETEAGAVAVKKKRR